MYTSLMRTRPTRGHETDRGSVTAEFAIALPVVVLLIALAASALGAGGLQVRLEHAAAQGARAAARGESGARVDEIVSHVAGAASVRIGERGDLVCVTTSADPGLALPLPPLRATSCALGEGR